jgi:site-specific DNA recombinase
MIKFEFYGRVSTEDQQDPRSSRSWQLTRSRALIESRGGVIVTEFFDVDKSRSIPWQRRPEATALLAELKSKNREFGAAVIGEPHRAILINPRYTGHQVWNKQRKDEVLIDVDDVGLGHTTKLRWNDTGKWLWSEKIVQPPIVEGEAFRQVQAMVAGRAHTPTAHKPHRAQHPYALRGCVWCGLCGRRMQSHWVHDAPYYRCRFAAEYALANHVAHPLSVNLREDAVIGRIDRWLTREFAPHRLLGTISDLAAVQFAESATGADDHGESALKIAECDRKLTQYRAAL